MTKPEGYYGLERADLVAELPRPIGRVLDVGCGEGGVGRSLRAAGATEVHGIEVIPAAAAIARESLDSVYEGTVEAALLAGAPWPARSTRSAATTCSSTSPTRRSRCAASRSLAADGGHLHISIPNARHFSLVYDLVVSGTFGYTEFGHRDATHLRWLPRRDLHALVAATRLGGRCGSAATCQAATTRRADRLTGGRAREFLALQWRVLARAA